MGESVAVSERVAEINARYERIRQIRGEEIHGRPDLDDLEFIFNTLEKLAGEVARLERRLANLERLEKYLDEFTDRLRRLEALIGLVKREAVTISPRVVERVEEVFGPNQERLAYSQSEFAGKHGSVTVMVPIPETDVDSMDICIIGSSRHSVGPCKEIYRLRFREGRILEWKS